MKKGLRIVWSRHPDTLKLYLQAMFKRFLACKKILAADAKDLHQLHKPEIEADEISILLEVFICLPMRLVASFVCIARTLDKLCADRAS